jgi:hypothetical protein
MSNWMQEAHPSKPLVGFLAALISMSDRLALRPTHKHPLGVAT